uniref:Uncharacterized protein n=1 Tax=Anopheles atroparvus TaxID=41427 RepID=A0A182J0A5_ANOAO
MIELTEQSVPGDNTMNAKDDQQQPSDETEEVDERPELQADVIEGSAQLADEPIPDAPPAENVEPVPNITDESAVASGEQAEQESADKREGSVEEVNEEPCVKRNKREASLEEVLEEPCIKREVTPTKSTQPDTDDTDDKQVEELEEIKKVDLSQLSKDSAEALFYSLKKSELENQEPEGSVALAVGPGNDESIADDDDKDVVVAEEPPQDPSSEATTKRTFTDDFLDEGPITENQPANTAPSDGVQQDPVELTAARSPSEAGEQEDEFNPMVMVSMRSKQFQEQLHSRVETEQGDGQGEQEPTPKRPLMRRCMTEMTGLQRYDTAVEEDPVDSRAFDLAYVEEEDQFDGYYIGHIKNKILASSVSVADSDYFDPAQSSEEPVDENNVRTALETIASTDTESTIASQATIQQAGKRSYLRKHSQNTSTNIPYASFGNAAIDRSLDEFIEREEQNKQDEAMAEAATKIQRSYRTHKKRLLRDYHSTMRTFTEDQSAESGEEYAASVIQIKLDQKRADNGSPSVGDGGGEESDTTAASLHPHQPLGTGKRPMYSLNIDEYDTVARRMTLTRGVALQRTSTPEDDSGKSANASTDRKPSLNSAPTPDSAPASSGSGEGQVVAGTSTSSQEKSDPPKVEEPSAPRSSSGEQEHKEGHSSPRSRPHRTAPGATGREPDHGSVPKGAGRTTIAQLDVQSLLLIARQRTMPVQIDSSVIRVLPKHMRKRISSAGMLNGAGKRK